MSSNVRVGNHNDLIVKDGLVINKGRHKCHKIIILNIAKIDYIFLIVINFKHSLLYRQLIN